MKNFREFIAERKQVGIVYHFTTEASIKILSDKSKMAEWACDIFTFVSNNGHFSTTRSFTTTSFKFAELNASTHPIRIALDGNKISDKFRVKAVNGLGNNDKEIFGTYKNSIRVPHKDEQEEVICPLIGSEVFSMKDYIVEIQINEYFLKTGAADTMKHNLEKIFKDAKLNIVVTKVRKWTPFKGEIKNEVNESISGENNDVTNYYIYQKEINDPQD